MRNALIALALTCFTLPAHGGVEYVAGSSEYHNTSSAVVSAASFSIFVWCKPADDSSNQLLFGIANSTDNGQFYLCSIRGDIGGDPIDLTSNAGAQGNAVTSNGFSVGTWSPMLFIEAGSSRTVVLDGDWANRGTEGTSVGAPSGLDRTTIGRQDRASVGQYLSASVAFVTVWSVALTEDESNALANRQHPLTVRPESRIAFWPMDGNGPVGAQVRDRGPSALHLTTVGGTPTKTDSPLLHGIAPRYGSLIPNLLQRPSPLHRFTRCRLEEPSYALAA